jgi:hypothetical protein
MRRRTVLSRPYAESHDGVRVAPQIAPGILVDKFPFFSDDSLTGCRDTVLSSVEHGGEPVYRKILHRFRCS